MFLHNFRSYGFDIITFLGNINYNGRDLDLDFSKPLPFESTFGKYFLCYNGSDRNVHFYIMRMKIAEKYARKLGITTQEFLNKIRNGRGGQLSLYFLTSRYYFKPVWRKKSSLNLEEEVIGRLDYNQNWLNGERKKLC